jgi:hypothetical protein
VSVADAEVVRDTIRALNTAVTGESFWPPKSREQGVARALAALARLEAAEAQRDTFASLCEMYRANVDAIRRDLPKGTIRQRLERLLVQVSDAALAGVAPPEEQPR